MASFNFDKRRIFSDERQARSDEQGYRFDMATEYPDIA
jgi:hypothetical protein